MDELKPIEARISKSRQLEILEKDLEIAYEAAYTMTVRARVCKTVGDDRGLENVKKSLVMSEKKIEALEDMKKELENSG